MQKKKVSTTKPHELLHMDQCGSIKVQISDGKVYMCVTVDNYSTLTSTMFPRYKDEIHELLVVFPKKIKVKVKNKIAGFSSDHGTKFENA